MTRSRWLPLRYYPIVSIIIIGMFSGIYFGIKSLQSAGKEPQAVEYVGRVIDEESRMPIRNAKILFIFSGTPMITYSDSEGVFRFIVEMDNDMAIKILVQAEGYNEYDRNITLRKGTLKLEDVRLVRNESEINVTPVQSVPSIATISGFTGNIIISDSAQINKWFYKYPELLDFSMNVENETYHVTSNYKTMAIFPYTEDISHNIALSLSMVVTTGRAGVYFITDDREKTRYKFLIDDFSQWRVIKSIPYSLEEIILEGWNDNSRDRVYMSGAIYFVANAKLVLLQNDNLVKLYLNDEYIDSFIINSSNIVEFGLQVDSDSNDDPDDEYIKELEDYKGFLNREIDAYFDDILLIESQ